MKRMWSKEELDKMIEQGGGGGDVTASDIDSEDATAGQVLQADGNGGSVWADINDVVADDIDSESATQGQVLTADGNGGATWENASGGEQHLYRHQVVIVESGKSWVESKIVCYVAIFNTSSTPFTFASLTSWLEENNYAGIGASSYMVNGHSKDSTQTGTIIGLSYYSSVYQFIIGGSSSTSLSISISNLQLYGSNPDRVTQIF